MPPNTELGATRGDRSSRENEPLVLPEQSYDFCEVIGRGGMGEVVSAIDQRFGREVAIKRMVATAPDKMATTRFLREARIQARLDHPSIVPVYELGVDPAGRPYFTMKRITGVTLSQRLVEGAALQQLLRAFVDVCLAIDLAHSRGVVHRDLKPSNIMLGDFGEVYVIDWGVARVLAERTPAVNADLDPISTLDGATSVGALIGTFGYMAPEQVRGVPAEEPADIYALGSILFELLADTPLHPRGTEALASTLSSPQDSPRQRRPERPIAPELDQLCFEALAETPQTRPSARALATRVQAYLDGDRDLVHREALATTELAAAHSALESATDDARISAIRHAGRALALAPGSIEASELVTSLIVTPPARLPPALEASLEREAREATRVRTMRGTYAYASVFVFWLVVPFLDVRSWGWLVAFNVILAVLSAFGWHAARRGRVVIPLAMFGNLVLAIAMTRIAGPFLLTPLLICGVLLAFAADPWVLKRPWSLLAWGAVTVMTPFALEWLGILDQTWAVDRDGFLTRSVIYEMPGTFAAAALVAANAVFVCVVGLFALGIQRNANRAQRQLHIQAWHLRHLLPGSR